MPSLRIHGRVDPAPAPPELARGLPSRLITPKHSVLLHSARAGLDPIQLDGVADDDAVELELHDGIRLWTRVDDLRDDFGLYPSRGAGDAALELPTTLRARAGGSRGAGEWAIKGLKLFGIDVAGSIVDFVSRNVEGRLSPGPGLYRCGAEGPGALAKLGALAAGPTLVLLHGTASSTEGSFGNLWDGGKSALIHRLLRYYEGRVLAFQHRTLTESPVQNAVALAERLAKALPAGSPLHLLSHSRGGLVGELIARGMRVGGPAFDAEDIARFRKDRGTDRQGLKDLRDLLGSGRFAVARFVRVACPARGTTLADRRLDRYFSLLTNLAGLLPLLKANPVYDGLTSLLAGVLKKRTDPEELPGLEAMMPGSALIGLLNRQNVQTRADLHVLGGDLAGTGVWGRLKSLASDFFYRDDHDLVVNTPAMFGGVERSGPVRYWIDQGGEVTHFNYFRKSETTTRLADALLDPDETTYHTFARKTSDQVTSADYRKRAAAPQPVVLVLPGIMGSTLSAGGRSVWMDYLSLGRGGMAEIAMGAAHVNAVALVGSGYQRLVQHLSQSHEVVPFPYDWRRSIEESGERLRQELVKRVAAAALVDQPVRIVAHSMGGLVVRAMLATAAGRDAWAAMCRHPGARLVMLGTPNGGSHAIAALLMGRDALAKKLALLDLTHDYAELIRIIAGFDGVLNLLPHGGDPDLLDPAAWDLLHALDVPSARGLFSSSAASSKSAGLAWTVPQRRQLAEARRMRDLLQRSEIDPNRMIYVAGVARETACAVAIDKQAPAGRRVSVLATARGDGRVTWASGIPAGLQSRTYYMDAAHGDLASAEEHFPAIVDLLSSGATTKLPQSPPAGRGAADELFTMRSPDPEMLPDAEDLAATALGSAGRVAVQAPVARVHVRVVHGNLARARSPVLVGHYKQDMLVHAEAYLDLQLQGRLSELHRMDLYPGDPGTATVVLNEPGSGTHPGAIVVGLGLVGSLTPGSLLRTITNGLASYGAERLGWARRRRQRETDSEGLSGTVDAPVTVILVGSGEGGVTLSDSLLTILRAVRQANERLRAARPPAGSAAGDGAFALIPSVEILELYEDRAIQAVMALNRLGESADVRNDFVIEELLVSGPGGRQRASYEESPGWLQRIRITTTRKGSLKFEAVTQKARASSYLGVGQRRNVELFLDHAGDSTALDPELGHTLFEMLVPPPFKEHAPERQRLALMLDAGAAALPWELLHDRYDRGSRPLAVEAGMIRQLLMEETGEERREPTEDTALVIGNPYVSDPRFAALPGAEDEAKAVAACLLGRYDVTQLLGREADPRSVISRLHERPWRILHLAAHGVFEHRSDPQADPVTGMVLDEGIVLSPSQLAQLRFVPDLVFVNCCHLGRTEGDAERGPRRFHRLAANVATEFIRMGARAVVAAGWAVDDAAARDFAVRLYQEMLAGAAFGDAVRLAREEAYQGQAGTNTWGAYQCYGDAAFTLRTRRSSAPFARLVAVRELSLQAGTWARDAGNHPERRAELLGNLEQLLSHTPAAWLDDAGACAAIAEAYAELDEFERAIEYYRRSTSRERSDGPLRALEQLANLQARWAVVLARAASGSAGPKAGRRAQAAKARKLLASSEALARELLSIAATAERHALLGAVHKRQAMVSEPGRAKALAAMASAYGAAHAVARAARQGNAWYGLANRLAAQLVLGWRRGGSRKGAGAGQLAAVASGLAELQACADALAGSATAFWELSLRSDWRLLAALRTGVLDAAAREEIGQGYRQALRRGGSPREIRSVIEHLEFFEEMARTRLAPRQSQALRDSLRSLRESLKQTP